MNNARKGSYMVTVSDELGNTPGPFCLSNKTPSIGLKIIHEQPLRQTSAITHLLTSRTVLRSPRINCKSLPPGSAKSTHYGRSKMPTNAERADLLFVRIALGCGLKLGGKASRASCGTRTYLLQSIPVFIAKYNAVVLECPLVHLSVLISSR